ncbi:MAG: ZPR1-type zinc finger protein [Candidatus Njordarchaeales archaeon]
MASKEDEQFKVMDLNRNCPVCGAPLIMIYKSHYLTYYGGIFIMTIKCTRCNFRITDILAISEFGENKERYSIKIDKDHISDLLVISGGALVQIPEMGLELTFSTSGGEITTVEGILFEMKKNIEIMAKDTPSEKLKKILEVLDSEIKSPTGKLTLELIDNKKKSVVIPYAIWTRRAESERESNHTNSRREALEKKALRMITENFDEKIR